MAVRGTRPKAAMAKRLAGNPGGRPLHPPAMPDHPGSTDRPSAPDRPRPPVKLTGRARGVWNKHIAAAHWLTSADALKAWAFCQLQAQFEEDPSAFTAARIGQWRALGSELGLDPTSRARLGVEPAAPYDPVEALFE